MFRLWQEPITGSWLWVLLSHSKTRVNRGPGYLTECLETKQLHQEVSLRTADVFPVGGREATTGNTFAVRRKYIYLLSIFAPGLLGCTVSLAYWDHHWLLLGNLISHSLNPDLVMFISYLATFFSFLFFFLYSFITGIVSSAQIP